MKKPEVTEQLTLETIYECLLQKIHSRIFQNNEIKLLNKKKIDKSFNMLLMTDALINAEYRAYIMDVYSHPKKYKYQMVYQFFNGFLKVLKKSNIINNRGADGKPVFDTVKMEKYRNIIFEELKTLIKVLKVNKPKTKKEKQ